MGSEERYPQAANEDIDSDSAATVDVSRCHRQDHSLRSWLVLETRCVIFFFIKLDWV